MKALDIDVSWLIRHGRQAVGRNKAEALKLQLDFVRTGERSEARVTAR